METENLTTDSPGTAAHGTCSDSRCCFDTMRDTIADALHNTAVTLEEKAADFEEQPQIAHYVGQASEWLERSSHCVRQYDYRETDAKFREYVRQSPGRSLLIAGVAGLAIGIVLRRR